MSSFLSSRTLAILSILLLLSPAFDAAELRVDQRQFELPQARSASELTRPVAPAGTCGNGVLDEGESCDGSDLGGETCRTLGFLGGELACDPSCEFDPSPCLDSEVSPGDIVQAFFSSLGETSCLPYLTEIVINAQSPLQVQTRATYGAAIFPSEGPDFLLLSTGDPDAPETSSDVDFAPPGCEGDGAQVTFVFDFPDVGGGVSAVSSLSFDFDFFSYEFPEVVGVGTSDYALAFLDAPVPVPVDTSCQPSDLGAGCLLTFDAKGNPTNVDSAFFRFCSEIGCDDEAGAPGWEAIFNVDPGDDSGRTGQLITCSPTSCGGTMTPGVHTLTLMVGDVSNGINTSAALFDNLRCHSAVQCEVAGTCSPAPEVCDGEDNDCDDAIDEEIPTSPTTCGVGACAAEGESECVDGELADSCVAGEPGEETCDGIDNDCDGATDEDLPAAPTECGVGACSGEGRIECIDGEIVDSCVIGESSAEICDGLDNDCDRETDEELLAEPTQCGLGECAAEGIASCIEGQIVDTCLAGEPTVEICDGLDNDCDRETDEELPSEPTQCGLGECAAEGVSSCVEGKIVDSCVAGEPTDEICDGLDNDCDGATDEELPSTPTQCGLGACAAEGVSSCVEGKIVDSCVAGEPTDEVCDGLDNDCDGATDEELPSTPTQCGLGACAAEGVSSCVEGKIVDSCVAGEPTDEICDGLDNDCDGATDEELPSTPTQCGLGACAAEGVSSCVEGQIVDTCVAGEPTDEFCDSLDNDCDGETDEDLPSEPTQCGLGACAAEGVSSCVEGEIVDSCVAGEPTDEVCDGLDNDCDGATDEELPSAPTQCGVGACSAEGVIQCIDGKIVDSCVAGDPTEEICDGLDNDCDRETDELPSTPTQCGVGACAAEGVSSCIEGEIVDSCEAGEPADEICDGLDNDCDGATDEDLSSNPTQCGIGACAAEGVSSCVEGKTVDTCTAGEPSQETCDGLDNDCDANTDEDLPSTPTQCGSGVCAAEGISSCVEGEIVDSCEAGEPSQETCDGLDNDCDGATDEDLPSTPTQCGIGACAAEGVSSCVEGEIVDSCEAGEPTEETCEGLDNDCDGATDEDLPSTPTQCGAGVCAAEGISSCVEGEIVDSCEAGEPSQEICDGLDNDCDGDTDEDLSSVPTQCGVGACAAEGVSSCIEGKTVDSCTPGEPAEETCDGQDNDCDGDSDGPFDLDEDGHTTCAGDCNDENPSVNPSAPEICEDGQDNDCNGEIDDEATCGVLVHFSTSASEFQAGAGTLAPSRVYSLTGEPPTVVESAPAFLPSTLNLDAVDVRPDGDILFSVGASANVQHAGGWILLKTDDVYRFHPGSGEISVELDWAEWGIDPGNVDALEADGNSLVFSTAAVRNVSFPGGSITLRPQSAYRLVRTNGSIELVLDGVALGLASLDAVELVPGGIVFSTGSNVFVSGQLLRQQNAYTLLPGGSLAVAFDGQALGLETLDALSLPGGVD